VTAIDDEQPRVPPLSSPPAAPPLSAPEQTQLSEDTDESPGDPFEGWPASESSAVIEESPPDGSSVEHVRGEVDVPDGFTVLEGTPLGNRRSVGVVVSRFNGGVTNRMLRVALDALLDAGVSQDAITVMPVPGAFELPLAALYLADSGRYAGVACLGAVIRGETDHYDYVCTESARGIQDVQLRTGVPCAFGVLTVENMDQALARSGGGKRDQGEHAAEAVMALAAMRATLAD
jgi:6,7-dimethyl-8-ribityllumazine synthase